MHACASFSWLVLVLAGAGGPRDLRNGSVIPDEGYCDQPYVVVLDDGAWLCTLTTGRGREGDRGQHVVATRSADKGKTWSALVDIEPADGPEASWVVPFVAVGGRVYAFYTYNGDRVGALRGKPIRADMLGWCAYRYSDDGGRTWSDRRRVPLRVTDCDRGNDWQGRVQIFWGIDKPKTHGGEVLFAFTKLGRYMLEDGEGWVMHSDNLLTERDPDRLRWDLRPQGERGIRAAAFGSVQEEHNHVPLSDGSLYCVYRTTQGFPCHTYSRDGGRSWSPPEPMTYAPGGRTIKNPRACPKLWRTADGRFLFWHHNHGGRSFEGRNPAWLCGGVEKDRRIHWSQPEIVLYDDAPSARMSYPDLIEQDGRWWITETQKEVARVHEIDPALLEGLWNRGTKTAPRDGLVLELKGGDLAGREFSLPAGLDASRSRGLTIQLRGRWDEWTPGQALLAPVASGGCGVSLIAGEGRTVRVLLHDGERSVACETDPGLLAPGARHSITAIVEAGPRIVLLAVDGVLCDGGNVRPQGWRRFDVLGEVGGGRHRVAVGGRVEWLRVYARPLRVSEAAE